MSRQPSSLLLHVLALAVAAPAHAQVTDPDLAPHPFPPEPTRVVTLPQALAMADQDATDLLLLRLQIERGEAAERVAWAGILPIITGTATLARWDESIVRAGVGTVRDANQVNAQISASETLSLRTLSAVRIAETVTDIDRMTLEDARRLAHGSIGRLFYTVLATHRAAELSRVQTADAVRLLEAARARVELGAGVELDAQRAEVAALDAARRTADADAALTLAWDQLGYALGRSEPVAARSSRLPALPEDEETAIEAASIARADVRLAVLDRALASLAIKDAWFRLAPSLTISWVGTVNAPTTLFNPDAAQWIASATLSIPLYDGGARYGWRRDAEAARAQADARLAEVHRVVRLQIRDAMRQVEIAERGARIAARQADIARAAAESAEASYRLGNLTGLELDAARQAREEAELERVIADLDLTTAKVNLLMVTGEL